MVESKRVIGILEDMRYDPKKPPDPSGPAKPAEGNRGQNFIPKTKGTEASLVLNEQDVSRLELVRC